MFCLKNWQMPMRFAQLDWTAAGAYGKCRRYPTARLECLKGSRQKANEPQLTLPFLTDAAHVVEDYAATGLSLKAHPVSFVQATIG
jgi:hypothetical protein